MDQSKKNLKVSSIVILLLGVWSLVDVLLQVFFGEINNANVPAGAPDNILEITRIFLIVVSALILLPQFYIGIKGIAVANKPNSSKGHIRWAIVLLVFTIIGFIDAVIRVIGGESIKEYISVFANLALEGVLYYEYIVFARLVAKEN
jgi:hypothetical protein